jgi:phenylpropionate dioxygenase-like ring-hydroxylating dioxygenase large terminal subunit
MWHDLTSKQFGRTLTVVYVTPIAKGKCRLFARFPFKFSSKIPKFFIQLTPQWYSHLNQNAILEDDQIFLYGQERYLDALGGAENYAKVCYLPTPADRYVSQFRRWLNDYQADPFPGQSFEPPQPRAQLLDRYHSHTAHCRSCSQALRNFQRLRLGLAIGIAIAGGSLPLLLWGLRSESFIGGISLTGLIWAASGLWFYLSRFERRFKEGRSLPPRNFPEPQSKGNKSKGKK